MRWSLIVFFYNEKDAIIQVLDKAYDFVKLKQNEGSELIIVNDGSIDGSNELFEKWKNGKNDFRYINHEINKGIGAALKSGYSYVNNEYVCAVPGDGQFDISLLKIIQPFDDRCFVSFYRIDKNYNLYRQLLTNFNNLFNKLFLGISVKDINWIKVYKKSQILSIKILLESSLIESEITSKLLKSGCRVIELPSEYLPRKGGVSKGGSFQTLMKAIKELFLLYKVNN